MDIRALVLPGDSKILLVVLDGLGGMADADHVTELDEAATPNLDRLAAEGVTGLLDPVGAGITPGSGPGHLALFGYEPLQFELGRGALSAAGLGFLLLPGDVAARGNLCTLDGDGIVVDRRAGRIADDDARRLVERLQREVEVPGVEVFFRHERQHRLLVVLRGKGLDPQVSDTDPQATGIPPLEPRPLASGATRTAEVAARGSGGPAGPGRRAGGHRPPAAGLRLPARAPVVHRAYRTSCGGRRGLPHVPGDRSSARHDGPGTARRPG